MICGAIALHLPGEHGGTIVAVGQNHYHVEGLIAQGGVLKLFTLGQDFTRVEPIPMQKITAYVRARIGRGRARRSRGETASG